jgi:hypothetical protein
MRYLRICSFGLALLFLQCGDDPVSHDTGVVYFESVPKNIKVAAKQMAVEIQADSLSVSGIQFRFVDVNSEPIEPDGVLLVTVQMFVADSLSREFVVDFADSQSATFTVTLSDLPPQAGGLVGDWDYNDVVDHGDYFLFVDALGSNRGEPSWDERMNLDGDEIIGIGDLYVFVDQFGKSSVAGKPVAVSGDDWLFWVEVARNLYGIDSDFVQIAIFLCDPSQSDFNFPAHKPTVSKDLEGSVEFKFIVDGYSESAVELSPDFDGEEEFNIILNKWHPPFNQIQLTAAADFTARVNLDSLAGSDDALQYSLEFEVGYIPRTSIESGVLEFTPEDLEGRNFQATLTATDGAGYSTQSQILFRRTDTTFILELTAQPDSIHLNRMYNLSEFGVQKQTFLDGELFLTQENVPVDRILGIPSEESVLRPANSGLVQVTLIVGRARQDFIFEVLHRLPDITHKFVVNAPDTIGIQEPLTVSAELITYEDGLEVAREHVIPEEGVEFEAFLEVSIQTLTFHYNEFEYVVEMEVVFRRPTVVIRLHPDRVFRHNTFGTVRVDVLSLEGVLDTIIIVATSDGLEDIEYQVELNQSVDPTRRWGYFNFHPPEHFSKTEDVYWRLEGEGSSVSGLLGTGFLEVKQNRVPCNNTTPICNTINECGLYNECLPDIAISTSELEIESLLDSTGTGTFMVYNRGKANLNVNDIESSSGEFSALPTSFDVPAQDSLEVTVTFTPLVGEGVYSSTLTVRNNDQDLILEVAGTGVVFIPELGPVILDLSVGGYRGSSAGPFQCGVSQDCAVFLDNDSTSTVVWTFGSSFGIEEKEGNVVSFIMDNGNLTVVATNPKGITTRTFDVLDCY